MPLPPPPRHKPTATIKCTSTAPVAGPQVKIVRLKIENDPRVWNWMIVHEIAGREELIASGRNYETSRERAESNFLAFKQLISNL